jgi:FkbM family methyltransferase
MLHFLHRCLGFAQRFVAAAWHFGWVGAFRVFVLHRLSREDRLTQIWLRVLQRPFWFRSRTDAGVLGMFYLENYRIADAYGPLCRVIIDAGANIGDSTMRLRRFHPQARIIAIEADADNHGLLARNFADDQQVTCLHRALWKEEGTLRIAKTWAAVASRIDEAGVHPISASVSASTVPGLMAEFGFDEIDILKLDIEGAEKVVFQTSDTSWIRRVRCIIFECCDADDHGTTIDIYAALQASGARFNSHLCGENIVLIRADTDWFLAPDLWMNPRADILPHLQEHMQKLGRQRPD